VVSRAERQQAVQSLLQQLAGWWLGLGFGVSWVRCWLFWLFWLLAVFNGPQSSQGPRK
jgi:hypothetical protein